MKRTLVDPVTRQKKHSCGVCGMVTASFLCGVAVCEACKKFFVRNRNNLDKLSCVTKEENCSANCETNASIHSLVRRQFCPKCRLKKCLEIGLRKVYNKVASSSESANGNAGQGVSLSSAQSAHHSDIAAAPTNHECTTAEWLLKMTMAAATELSAFDSVPFTVKQNEIFTDELSLWEHAMHNFEVTTQISANYIEMLGKTIAKQLSANDQRNLCLGSVPANSLLQCTLPSHNEYRYFGMPDSLRRVFLSHFPAALPVDQIVTKVSVVMEAWNPSFAEYSLLQALALFRADLVEKLEQPGKVSRLYKNLLLTLNSLLSQRGPTYYKSRIAYFNQLNALVLECLIASRHSVTQMATTKQAQLLHKNEVFCEFYQDQLVESTDSKLAATMKPNDENI